MSLSRTWAVFCCWLWACAAFGQEVIPAKPTQYFNDYAHVASAATAAQLNAKLDDFERATSDQVLVAIYPKMQSDSSIADYTIRVARAWQVGKKGKNNGVVFFVFVQDHQMFIQVGYGLEGALPDATCKQITEYEVKPRFKVGDYDGGLTAGVNAILAATQHEYKGTGATVNDSHYRHSHGLSPGLLLVIVIAFIIISSLSRRRGWAFGSGGWGGFYGGGWGGGGGGGWSGGGGGGGGGGGFSSGGGSFGGGGAGSSW